MNDPRNRLFAAVLVVAAACAVFFAWQERDLRDDNLALADPAATGEVTEQVSAGLKAVFSVDYADLDRVEQAADLALTGAARRDFDAELAENTKRIKKRKEVRASSVRSIGVRTLTPSRATLLVFLDQQSLRGSGLQTSTATLYVTAVRVDGSWRISKLEPL